MIENPALSMAHTSSLKQIVASGGHLRACRTSADMNRLTKDDLYDEVDAIFIRPTSSR